jgi:hypothetical protein
MDDPHRLGIAFVCGVDRGTGERPHFGRMRRGSLEMDAGGKGSDPKPWPEIVLPVLASAPSVS